MSRYGGYHGKNTARSVLKIILTAVAVVLATALAVLLIGQRYIVYTDDGVRLELPFFQREETVQVDESTPVDIVQIPAPPKTQPEVQPEGENTAQNGSEKAKNEQDSG